MLDEIKEKTTGAISDLAEAIKNRLRSPVVVSFVVSWAIANWRLIAIIGFGNGSMQSRLAYIDHHDMTALSNLRLHIIPAVAAILYVVALPVLSWWLDSCRNWTELKRRCTKARHEQSVEDAIKLIRLTALVQHADAFLIRRLDHLTNSIRSTGITARESLSSSPRIQVQTTENVVTEAADFGDRFENFHSNVKERFKELDDVLELVERIHVVVRKLMTSVSKIRQDGIPAANQKETCTDLLGALAQDIELVEKRIESELDDWRTARERATGAQARAAERLKSN
jgi:archaellum component FlaC